MSTTTSYQQDNKNGIREQGDRGISMSEILLIPLFPYTLIPQYFMVTNFRQERMEKERRRKLYGAFFVILIIFVLGRGPIFSFLGRIGSYIGLPLWRLDSSITESVDYLTEYSKPRSALVNEILTMRHELESKNGTDALIKTLEEENRNIRQLFGRNTDEKRLLARVLSRPPFQIYDTVVIDVGSIDGITEGSIVYIDSNFVLGKVTRVNYHTSVVTLSSAPGEHYPIMITSEAEGSEIGNSSQNEVVFYGIGGGGFVAEVPKHVNVASGTSMVFSSINPTMIGIISGESIPETGSLKQVYGSLPYSIKSIDWVSVDIKASENI